METISFHCNTCGKVEIQTKIIQVPDTGIYGRKGTHPETVPDGESCPKCKKLMWQLIASREASANRSALKLRTTHDIYRELISASGQLPGQKIPKGRAVPFENDETIRNVTVQATPELWQNAKFAKEFAGLQCQKAEEKPAPALKDASAPEFKPSPSAAAALAVELKAAIAKKAAAPEKIEVVVVDEQSAAQSQREAAAQEWKDQKAFDIEVHSGSEKVGIRKALANFSANPRLWRAVKEKASA